MKKLFLSIVATALSSTAVMADTDISAIDNILEFKPTTIQAGTTGTVSVNMKNSDNVQSIGLYFYLPDGMSVPYESDNLKIKLSTARTGQGSHSLFCNYLQDLKEYRVGILQTTGKAFNGNEGEVFTIDVAVPENMPVGNYILRLSNQEFSNATAEKGILMKDGIFEGTITVTEPNGIQSALSDSVNGIEDIYTLDGIKTQSVNKGLNIIKKENGEVIKVVK